MKPNGPGPGGATWDTAYPSIAAAIQAAAAGDSIWVAAGTYPGPVTLKAGIALYGGFTGTETALDQRNSTANVTTIDGQKNGSAVSIPQSASGVTVDGFTIRNGTGTAVSSALMMGGGVYCAGGSAVIAHNTIVENSVTMSDMGVAQSFGGGIACLASATITDNLISDNSASGTSEGPFGFGQAAGGGIFVSSAAAIIRGNTIARNTVSGGGPSANIVGAGIAVDGGTSTIERNLIIANVGGDASNGGGLFFSNTATTVSSNTIVRNTATLGSALEVRSGSPKVVNNTMVDNTSTENYAVQCGSSTALLANNIIAFNSHGLSGAGVLSHNDVYGNTGGDYIGMAPGATDVSVDPVFIDRAADDYHLRVTSPLIDAGDDSAISSAVDIDGDARLQGAHVDIGADEVAPLVPADVETALRIAGGFATATLADKARLDVVVTGDSAGRVDVADAVSLARALNHL